MTDRGKLVRRPPRGFTLVEILVAFAILVLTFAAVMQAMSGGLRILSVSGAHAEATRLAESRLAEAGQKAPLSPGVAEGTEGRYRWRTEVTPYDGTNSAAKATAPPLYLVTVTVRWNANRRVTLSTAEFGPPPNE